MSSVMQNTGLLYSLTCIKLSCHVIAMHKHRKKLKFLSALSSDTPNDCTSLPAGREKCVLQH